MQVKTEVTLRNFNVDNILAKVKFTEDEWRSLAGVIVDGITERILNQQTADGRPLSENSRSWLIQKEKEGKPLLPLQYTGGLRDPSTYQVNIDGDSVTIQLEAGYRQIHLDLYEISIKTGKNYKDWFGVSQEDIPAVMAAANSIVVEKVRRAFGA